MIHPTQVARPSDRRTVEFACVLVKDEPAENTPDGIAAVLECALANGGDVLSLDVSFILVSFGMIGGDADQGDARRRLSRAWGIGHEVSCVHGRREALVGDLGIRGRRLSLTILFRGYRECLRELASLEFGDMKEI